MTGPSIPRWACALDRAACGAETALVAVVCAAEIVGGIVGTVLPPLLMAGSGILCVALVAPGAIPALGFVAAMDPVVSGIAFPGVFVLATIATAHNAGAMLRRRFGSTWRIECQRARRRA